MSRARRIGADALRGLLAAMLFATALGKTLDVAGFVAVLRTYRALPTALEWPVALGAIVAEYALAVALLRRRSPPAALACALMHLAYAGWALVALLRELPIPNCGCFGVFLARPLGWNTVVEDLVVTALSVILWWLLRTPALRPRTRRHLPGAVGAAPPIRRQRGGGRDGGRRGGGLPPPGAAS